MGDGEKKKKKNRKYEKGKIERARWPSIKAGQQAQNSFFFIQLDASSVTLRVKKRIEIYSCVIHRQAKMGGGGVQKVRNCFSNKTKKKKKKK